MAVTDSNALKAVDHLASDENNTFISITQNLITDAVRRVPNPVNDILYDEALPVTIFTPDQISPVLLSFSIDLDEDTLTMIFNEPVRVSTIDTSFITILSNNSVFPNDLRALTGGIATIVGTMSNSSMMITISLTQPDIRYLKLSRNVATSIADTWLSVTTGAVEDMAGNPLVEISFTQALQATSFIGDVRKATLIGFDFDVNYGQLHLTFDDIINSTSFVPSAVTLQNAARLNENFVTLTSDSASISENGYFISISLSPEDLNRVKFNTQLATERSNTYLSLRAEAFNDNFGEDIVSVANDEALQVTNFTADTLGPILVNYTLDMDLQILHLTFDETVNITSLDVQEITLQSDASISEGIYYTLVEGETITDNSHIVSIYFSTEDFNEITRLSSLAISSETTYLSLTPLTILDMNSNQVEDIGNYSAQPVDTFIPDLTSPSLVSFSIDLTEEVLVLTFDETVNASSIDTTQFTIQGHPIQSSYRTLQNSTTSENDSTVITIYLGLSDLNEIKRLDNVATSELNTFISITSSAIDDMNDNPVNEIPPLRSTVRASDFTNDSIPPMLLQFNLDLSNETLTLKFSETVRVNTLHMNSFFLQSTPNNTSSTQCVQLTGGIGQSFDYHTVEVQLNTPDLDEIKRITDLATSRDNVYLSALFQAVEDMNSNPLIEVPKSMAVSVCDFTPDVVNPDLPAFNFDLNIGQITLIFDETVNVSSLDVTQITLQNSIMIDNNVSYQLSNFSYPSSNDSNIIQVIIDLEDLNEIKRLDMLATDTSDTYISITSDLVDDMNGNPINAISDTNALSVFTYTADMTPPELLEFDIDLNSSQLILRFDETVESDSLNTNSITLQNSQISSAISVQLSSSSETLSPDGTTLIVEISESDLNGIKRITTLATDENNTFISINNNTVTDMNNNKVVPILSTDALQVTNYTADMISPELREFHMNMDTRNLILSFTETVQCNSLNISSVTFYSSNSTLASQFTLTESSSRLCFTDDDPAIRVFVGIADLNAIKKIYDLATEEDNTYLSLSSDGVLDMNDLPILTAPPIRVTNYTADSRPPILNRFSLNLTSEVLSLTFGETVNTASLNITYLTLLSDENMTVASFIRLEDYRDITDENSTIVDILLATDQLHEIKLDTKLATSMNNTYLYITSGAIHDMALIPNYISDTTIQTYNFWPDETPPELQSFMVNMNDGSLTLMFDEPVDIKSINYEAFTLHSSQYEEVMTDNTTNATDVLMMEMMLNENYTNFTLSGGYTNSTNNLQITFYFTEDDLNEIKRDEMLYTSPDTSYITIDSTAISDMAGNPVDLITHEDALNASFFIADMTEPVLTNFSLDMNSGLLLITFSETVDVSTLMFTSLTIQKAPNITMEANRYSLTNGTLTMMADGTMAYVMLTDEDLNELKRRRIALTPETTWLLLDYGSIQDMSDLPVEAIVNPYAIMVMNYTTDSTPPELEAFVLDLDNETLTLTFSETVDIYKFNITAITLQDTENGTNMLNHFMFTESSEVSTPSMPVVTIIIGLEDLNRIKQLLELATNINNTYISIEPYLVRDVFGTQVEAINSSEALMAGDVIIDQTNPQLQAFDLNLNCQILILYFSETVNTTSLNVSGITLVSGQDADSDKYTLQFSYTPDNDTDNVTIILDITDFNEIKKLTGLATMEGDTHISIENFTISDVFSNAVEPIEFTNALLVNNYTKDVTRPQLAAYHLDMNAVSLTLEFTETVNVSSLDVTAITLVNSVDTLTAPITYMLMDSSSLSENGPVVVINFTSLDENNLKRIENLVTSINNTYVLISEALIRDMDGNPVKNVTMENATCCVWSKIFPDIYTHDVILIDFTQDTTPPELISYDLDLNSDTLRLTFTETVNTSSWYIPGIILQNDEDSDNKTTFYQLTDSNYSVYNDPVVDIYLSRIDQDEIRRLTALAVDNFTTYLTIARESILDMIGLNVSPVYDTSAQNVEIFTPDGINPYLEYFDLDLSEEILTLQFSETVSIPTIDAGEITLTNDVIQSVSYALTGGVVQNTDHNSTILISLSTADLNEVKVRPSLAISNTTTLILLTNYTVQDNNMNHVTAIMTPVTVREFTEDNVRPQLESFTMDVNNGLLILTFTETVNSLTLNVTGLTIQSHSNRSDDDGVEYRTLSTESFTESINGTEVTVNVSLQDLNVIKQLTGLAISNTTSYLTVTNYTITDMNNNLVEAVEATTAIMTDVYIDDVTAPELVSFILDLTNEIIILSFTETVNASSIDPTQLTIQSSGTSPGSGYIQLRQSNSTSLDNDTITIFINRNDLNLIKSEFDLGTTINDTYVSITTSFITDMAGNNVTAIEVTNALGATDVLIDETTPELLDFNFDLNQGVITFFFSEAVSVSSIDITEVTVQSESNATLLNSYTIMNQSTLPAVFNDEQTIVSITLTNDDLNVIKQREDLATMESGNDTFLSITSAFANDTAGNPIDSILLSSGIKVNQFTQDISCPSLVDDGFVLDLNEGKLYITFTETVRVSSINYTQITVQNMAVSPSAAVPLTGGSSESDNSPIIVIDLVRDDLDSIKIAGQLGNDFTDTFISFTKYSLMDMASNEYCNDTGAVQAEEVIEDITPPELDQYDVDLDAEFILLNFSEAIRLPINVTQITLYGGADNSSSYYELTDGTAEVGNKPYLIILRFNQDDLNEIKSIEDLVVSEDTTYVSLTNQTAQDYSGNEVVNVTDEEPMRVTMFSTDRTPPRLRRFALDMNTDTLELSFSEYINVSTVDITAITLQGSMNNDSDSYTLRNSSVDQNTSLTSITVTLSKLDSNALKLFTSIATLMTNTYISITEDLVLDATELNNVPINQSAAVMVRNFIGDMTAPMLLEFNLNLTTEILCLTFDEPVDADSLMIKRLQLQLDLDETDPLILNGDTISNNSAIICVMLTDDVLHEIKRDTMLATSENDTCLTISYGAVIDLASADNAVTKNTLCATGYTNDSVQPMLIEFGVDVNASTLTIVFDEPIDIYSINLTELTLQSAPTTQQPGVEEFTLTGGNYTTIDELTFVITLSESDANEIKQLTNLLRDNMTSFIRITSDFAVDMNDNPVNEINASMALQAVSFIDDTTRPVFIGFDLDMNTGTLILHFSETVNTSSINFTGITFRQESSSSSPHHTLTNGTLLSTNDSTDVFILLDNDDLNALKTLDIGIDNSSAYVVVDSNAVVDIVNQTVVDNFLNPPLVSEYSTDETPPLLERFYLDFTAETLTLHFNETVDQATLDVTQITLCNTDNSSTANMTYTLTDTSTSVVENLAVIVINLGLVDLNELKRMPYLGTSVNNTFIHFTNSTVTDTFGNEVVPIDEYDKLQAANVTNDNINPVLEGFELDMNTGVLTLSFSETVDSATLNTAGITLHDSPAPSNVSFTLNGSYVTVSPPSNIIQLEIVNSDLNEIKFFRTLATTEDDTFLFISPFTIRDMDGNFVNQSVILPTNDYSIDVTPPMLLGFSIDMDLGQLMLSFDETVMESSLMFTFLALRNNASGLFSDDTQHQLDNMAMTISPDSDVVSMRLSVNDLNEVKRKDLCRRSIGAADCFLVMQTEAIQDMSSNELQGCRRL